MKRLWAAIDADTDFEYDEDGNLILSEERRGRRTRIEMGLTASANALTLFKTQGQDDIIMAINQQTNIICTTTHLLMVVFMLTP